MLNLLYTASCAKIYELCCDSNILLGVFDNLHFLSINMALFIFIYLLNFFEILLYKYLTSLLLYALRACRGTIWLNSRTVVAIMVRLVILF